MQKESANCARVGDTSYLNITYCGTILPFFKKQKADNIVDTIARQTKLKYRTGRQMIDTIRL